MKNRFYEEKEFTNLSLENELIADTEFRDCVFNECQFTELNLQNVGLHECRFNRCTILNPEIEFSFLQNAEFKNCNLIGISWGILAENRYSILFDKLENNLLKYNNFIELQLPKSSFSTNEIINSNFEDCNLRGASFSGCQLDDTHFINNQLQTSDFTDAVGYYIDLNSNSLKNAKFSLPEAVHLLDSLDIKIR